MIDVRAYIRSVDQTELKLLIAREFFFLQENNADMTDVSTARLIKFAFGWSNRIEAPHWPRVFSSQEQCWHNRPWGTFAIGWSNKVEVWSRVFSGEQCWHDWTHSTFAIGQKIWEFFQENNADMTDVSTGRQSTSTFHSSPSSRDQPRPPKWKVFENLNWISRECSCR